MNDETGGESVGDDWADALAEQKDTEDDAPGQADAAVADFDNLIDESEDFKNASANMEMILDIPVTASVEIGRTKINISNLLKLNQGSVIELDRLAGEPMDVMVNGTLVAHGEVVVVNEKFGIRLTDVISPAERVKKLK